MPDVIPSSSLRVLVVDDCPDTTASMAYLLRCWKHETREAHDGPTALAVAAAFHPDVILLDIGLPGMDGCEVARRLRKLDLPPFLLAVVTGFARPEDRRRSFEAGCDCHLIKPIDLDALQRLLASRTKTRVEEAARPLSVLVRADPAVPEQGAAERAEIRLRGNAYLALKNISCKWQNGVLTLNGCLPSYYLKQVAQAAVAGVEGVKRIENRIEVVARG